MSVNFRNFGQAKQVLPKYLSDSLTPWWGAWFPNIGTLNIAYDNLPPASGVLARLWMNDANAGQKVFYFLYNARINQNGYVIDFWSKCQDNAPQLTLFMQNTVDTVNIMNTSYPYASGSAPIVWTRHIIPLDSLSYPANPLRYSRSCVNSQINRYLFYWDLAQNKTIELAGVHIRRL